MARVAVDVIIGNVGIRRLQAAGHEVVAVAQPAEPDREWFDRALAAGAEFVIACDKDLAILCHDHNIAFYRARWGVKGRINAERFISWFQAKGDDTLDHLARDVRRIAIKGEPTARDTRTLADALGVVIERLAETRRLVDALAGPVVAAPATLEFRSLDGKHTRTVTVDTDARPLAPALTIGASCDDCGSPFVALGHRFCARCQERDVLRAALREALDGWERAEHHEPTPRIAELRRLL